MKKRREEGLGTPDFVLKEVPVWEEE